MRKHASMALSAFLDKATVGGIALASGVAAAKRFIVAWKHHHAAKKLAARMAV